MILHKYIKLDIFIEPPPHLTVLVFIMLYLNSCPIPILYYTLPSVLNKSIIISLFQWNNTPGWENQEVAPRCELDRNQYLETGQLLESGEPAESVGRPEVDNNDEGEY